MLRTKQVPPLLFTTYQREPFIAQYDKSPQHNPDFKQSTPTEVNFEWLYHREPLNGFEISQLEHSVLNTSVINADQVLVLDIHRGQNNEPSLQLLQTNGHFYPPYVQNLTNNSDSNCSSSNATKTQAIDDNEDTSDSDSSVCYSSDHDSNSSLASTIRLPDDAQQHLRITFREAPAGKIKSSVRRMSLRGFPQITDKSLEYLRGLKVELLDVEYTNVTEKGVKEFMVEHPECRVIHRSACICGPRMHF